MKWVKAQVKPFTLLAAALLVWSLSAIATFESPQKEAERITANLLTIFEQNIFSYKKQDNAGVDLFIAEVD
ncbi:MAG: hypothetical protein ACPGEF_06640, partial [Endozoicomonas sp.]